MPSPSTPVAADDIDTDRIVEELKTWVSMESHTPDADAVTALAAHVEGRAASAGLSVRRVAGTKGFGDSLVVRHGSDREKGIVVLAHLDTVHAAGTIGKELPLREDGDKIYGPGIYDMKSGALMALEALKIAASKDNGPALPITILFVPDEEMGSVSSLPLIQEAGRNARYALVVEPARDGGKIVVARKGVAMYDIAVHGRASHAGTNPQGGRSAVREAARLVLELEALNDPARGVTVTVGTIRGGTGRNTIPALCELLVDVRVPDRAAADEILPKIEGLRPSSGDFRIEVSGGLNRPPFEQTAEAKRLFDHAAEIAHPLGIALEGMSTGGGSDGNFTAALGVPTLDGLGADGAGAHTFSEHIFKSSIAPRTALLANLMLTLGKDAAGEN